KRRARSAARLESSSTGLPLACLAMKISRNAMPRQPVPSAFIAASFAANRPATCSANARGCRRRRRISPGEKIRARKRSPNRSIARATRGTAARSRPTSTPTRLPGEAEEARDAPRQTRTGGRRENLATVLIGGGGARLQAPASHHHEHTSTYVL